METMTHAT